MDRTAAAAEIRMRWVIRGLMEKLTALTEQTVDWAYVAAIYDHMHLPLRLEDAPAQCLWKVLQALDTHVRRLERNGPHHKEVTHLKTA